jgi:hypothetical protein
MTILEFACTIVLILNLHDIPSAQIFLTRFKFDSRSFIVSFKNLFFLSSLSFPLIFLKVVLIKIIRIYYYQKIQALEGMEIMVMIEIILPISPILEKN